jgi:tRNA(fMet)-specific endonuclease VapC
VNKALLDTDIYSEVLKGVNPTVIQNAATYRQTHGVLTLSVITKMEIVKGCQKVQSSTRMRKFLMAISKEQVLPLGESAAEVAGRIAGELDRIGQSIGMADPIIAAIALEHGLELVTGNTAHFQRVQQLGYPLVLANWRT